MRYDSEVTKVNQVFFNMGERSSDGTSFSLVELVRVDIPRDLIPVDTDVLITHGPPFGILDLCSEATYKPTKAKVNTRNNET